MLEGCSILHVSLVSLVSDFKLEFSFIYLAPNPNSSHLKALYIVELSGNNGEKSPTIK